ncbi:MAG: hypothetical protein ACR2JB_08315 [Bryobacteraceae bacterium]
MKRTLSGCNWVQRRGAIAMAVLAVMLVVFAMSHVTVLLKTHGVSTVERPITVVDFGHLSGCGSNNDVKEILALLDKRGNIP